MTYEILPPPGRERDILIDTEILGYRRYPSQVDTTIGETIYYWSSPSGKALADHYINEWSTRDDVALNIINIMYERGWKRICVDLGFNVERPKHVFVSMWHQEAELWVNDCGETFADAITSTAIRAARKYREHYGYDSM